MAMYALYGARARSMDEAMAAAEAVAGAALRIRVSPHRGAYCTFDDPISGSLVLQENIDLTENAPREPDFPDARFLLYLNEVDAGSPLFRAVQKSPAFMPLRCMGQ